MNPVSILRVSPCLPGLDPLNGFLRGEGGTPVSVLGGKVPAGLQQLLGLWPLLYLPEVEVAASDLLVTAAGVSG